MLCNFWCALRKLNDRIRLLVGGERLGNDSYSGIFAVHNRRVRLQHSAMSFPAV